MDKHSSPDVLTHLSKSLVILQNNPLSDSKLAIHGTSTRLGGKSTGEFSSLNLGLLSGEDRSIILANRKILFQALSVPESEVVYGQQVHGYHVSVIDEKIVDSFAKNQLRRIPETDAMITRIPKIPLAILTADCIPVFILDKKTPAIGLAHAGWRGTKSQIAFHTVRKMAETFGTHPEDCIAWISVGINVCCYQVSEDLCNEFQYQYGDKIEVVNGDKLNLPAINRYQLESGGIPPDSIYLDPYCTYHDKELFYSYRRDGKNSGRMVSLLMLK